MRTFTDWQWHAWCNAGGDGRFDADQASGVNVLDAPNSSRRWSADLLSSEYRRMPCCHTRAWYPTSTTVIRDSTSSNTNADSYFLVRPRLVLTVLPGVEVAGAPQAGVLAPKRPPPAPPAPPPPNRLGVAVDGAGVAPNSEGDVVPPPKKPPPVDAAQEHSTPYKHPTAYHNSRKQVRNC